MSETPRQRAPAMSIEERRAMIVRAALPLVAEQGASVTTAQVARSAGIAEGTVFRAFSDKSELIAACFTEAADSGPTVAQLAAIPLDLPLRERLTEAADLLRARLDRAGRIMAALAVSGPGRAPCSGGPGPPNRPNRPGPPGPADRAAANAPVYAALAELLEPDAARLSLPPLRLAALLHTMLLCEFFDENGSAEPVGTGQLVDVLLNGALLSEGNPP